MCPKPFHPLTYNAQVREEELELAGWPQGLHTAPPKPPSSKNIWLGFMHTK